MDTFKNKNGLLVYYFFNFLIQFKLIFLAFFT